MFLDMFLFVFLFCLGVFMEFINWFAHNPDTAILVVTNIIALFLKSPFSKRKK